MSADDTSGDNHLPPGIGDVYGPVYPGNLRYSDRDYVPTNYGTVRLNCETMRRFWNGAEQEIVSGHWEATCPCCYEKHTVEEVGDDSRADLVDAILDCCDEVFWLPPSDYMDPCEVCGTSHRERHECTPLAYREPVPQADDHRYECTECDWSGDSATDFINPAGRCPECETTAVRAVKLVTDGGRPAPSIEPGMGPVEQTASPHDIFVQETGREEVFLHFKPEHLDPEENGNVELLRDGDAFELWKELTAYLKQQDFDVALPRDRESEFGDRMADAALSMRGEADELAARDGRDAHLDDVISGLRHVADELEEFLEEEYYE